MTYVANPTDGTRPLDSDDASGGAAELRALKAYLQGLVGGSVPLNGYSFQGFRNLVINGDFRAWQRGVSLPAGTGASRYQADQWASSSNGSTIAASRQSFVIGQTDVPYNPQFYHRSVVVTSAGAGNYANLVTPLESVLKHSGRQVVTSFFAKADAIKQIAVEYAQNFGTGGAPSAEVNALNVTKFTLGTTWQLFNMPAFTMPSITGKTLGSAQNDDTKIIFWFDAGSSFNNRTNTLGQQSGTFDLAIVQFEFEATATPFELRPDNIEYPLIQRYFCGGTHRQAIFNNTYIGGEFYFPARMRIPAPTLVASDLVGNIGKFTSAALGNNQSITGGALTNQFSEIIGYTDALINGGNGNWVHFNYTAEAVLSL